MSGINGPRVELIPVENVHAIYNAITKELTLLVAGQVTAGVTDIHIQQELVFPIPTFSLKGTYPGVPIVLPTRDYQHHQSFKFNIWPPVEDPSGIIGIYASNGLKTTVPVVVGFGPGPQKPSNGQLTAPMYSQSVTQQVAAPAVTQPQQISTPVVTQSQLAPTAPTTDKSRVEPGIDVFYPSKFKVQEEVLAGTSMDVSFDDTYVKIVDAGIEVPPVPLIGPTNLWWKFAPLTYGHTSIVVHFSGRDAGGVPFKYNKTYPVIITGILPPVGPSGPVHEQAQPAPVQTAPVQTAPFSSISPAPQATQPAKTTQDQKLANSVDMTVYLEMPFCISHDVPDGGSATLERYDASSLELMPQDTRHKEGKATWWFKPLKTGKTYVEIEVRGGIMPIIYRVTYNIEVVLPFYPPTGANGSAKATTDAQASKPKESNDIDLTVYSGENFTIKHSYPKVKGGSATLGPYDHKNLELVKHTDENGEATWTFKPLGLGPAHAQIEVTGNDFAYLQRYKINIILHGVPAPPQERTNGTVATNGTNGTA